MFSSQSLQTHHNFHPDTLIPPHQKLKLKSGYRNIVVKNRFTINIITNNLQILCAKYYNYTCFKPKCLSDQISQNSTFETYFSNSQCSNKDSAVSRSGRPLRRVTYETVEITLLKSQNSRTRYYVVCTEPKKLWFFSCCEPRVKLLPQ